MIAGIFHSGSGLGNQLHRYVATRMLALDKGYDFSMVAPENFKGKSFMNLDMGLATGATKTPGWDPDIKYITDPVSGKVTANLLSFVEYSTGAIADNPKALRLWEEKTNYYNPEFNFVKDNTVIDGEFQDERYFDIKDRRYNIDEWLKVEPLDLTNEVCVIGFRGGEFYLFPELGLPKEYFEEGIARIKAMQSNVRFEVHTDDVVLAKQFFPDYPCIHDIGLNWRSMRYAKYAIIPNSSFYIFPRLLKHHIYGDNHYTINPITIAPRYWARRNTKEWSMPQNYYKSFTYI